MEFDHIDIKEMERQRYESIKNSGEYLEFNVLIGVENEKTNQDGVVCKLPVVSTCGIHCGSEEISCLYMTLKAYTKHLEENYPSECFAAKLSMTVEESNHITTDTDTNEED